MLDRLRIRNLKSLRDVDLALGRVNLFVGANASGKSNVFDALRVLQGVARGLAVVDVLDGRAASDTADAWEALRGGFAHACFRPRSAGADSVPNDDPADVPQEVRERPEPAPAPEEFEIAVTLDIPQEGDAAPARAAYEIAIRPDDRFVVRESLTVGERKAFSAALEFDPDDGTPALCCVTGDSAGPLRRDEICDPWSSGLRYLSDLPGLWGAGDDARIGQAVCRALSSVQVLQPDVRALRSYAPDKPVQRLGAGGQDFAAVVKSIVADPARRQAYLSWLRELSAAGIEDVEVRPGASNDLLFGLREAGGWFPAPVVSDGTLRFAALVAAFFQPSMPRALLLEEIENGFHPSRIRTLVNLLRSQSAHTGTQVFATTHSPVVLAWLDETEYRTTFVCRRDEDTGATTITPLTEMPGLLDLARRRPVSELMTGGWMELAP